MIKLIKNIENYECLRKIQIKNKKSIENVLIINNRINNMIKIMKKMTLNVNAFMQKMKNAQ